MPTNPRQIKIVGRTIELRFPYDPAIIGAIKDRLPWTARRFKKDDQGPRWIIDTNDENMAVVYRILTDFFQPFDQPTILAVAQLCGVHLDTVNAKKQTAIMSRAVTANIEIPGLATNRNPYPFQLGGIAYGVQKRRTFLADEMGLGKTVQAIGVLQAVNAYPAICLTKASLTGNWRREWGNWVPGLYSTSEPKEFGDGSFYKVLVMSYNSLPKWFDWLKTIPWQAIVADESQYIKNPKSKRTECAVDLANDLKIPTRLALSGTPIDIKPSELISQLKFLGRLNDFGGWFEFATKYCGAYQQSFGGPKKFWITDGCTNSEELHEKLRSICYIRRTKAEVMPELPPKTRATVMLPIDNGPEYRRADQDVVAYLTDKKANEADVDVTLIDDEGEVADTSIVADLARVQVLKKLAAEGMLAGFEEWLEEFVESGKKLILFAHHADIQRELFERCSKVTKTLWTREDGSASEKIQIRIDRFQNDPTQKVIVCSLEGDNAGHTLTAAEHVGFFERAWTTTKHDQAEDRAHRIGQKGNVTCYYFVAQGTIYEDIDVLLNERRGVVDAVTDGKAMTKKPAGHIGKALLKKMTSQ